MLAGMVKVQKFGGSRPTVLGYVPNPRRAIPHHQHFLCSGQATPQRFPMQSPTDLQGLSTRANPRAFLAFYSSPNLDLAAAPATHPTSAPPTGWRPFGGEFP